jgi:hypothetical protein
MWAGLKSIIREICLLLHKFELKQLTKREVINLITVCNVIVTNIETSLCKLCA